MSISRLGAGERTRPGITDGPGIAEARMPLRIGDRRE